MKRMKRWISIVMILLMVVSVIPMNVAASEVTTEAEGVTENGYEPVNSYALNYKGKYGKWVYEYVSPYVPLISYTHVSNEPYTDWIGTSFLYNTADPENDIVSTYCVDQFTNVPAKEAFYQRMNLEESGFFTENAAAQLRSIVLNGFPHVSLETLRTASGVNDLTIDEAVTATQLAIWQTSYGSEFAVHNFVEQIYAWFYHRGYKNQTKYADLCYSEVVEIEKQGNNNQVLDEVLDIYLEENPIDKRIEKVYSYLINLAPAAPKAVTVSDASFINWSKNPVLSENEDGTYNVTVEATVNVVENSGDDLEITAVVGNSFVTKALNNGTQTVSLTIENVPAEAAKQEVTLAIDGMQTVGDVFLYALEGGRDIAQERIGYSNLTLPVHAEIKVEPERVIHITKTGKVATGNDTYETIPLGGITFDLYFYADWNEYISGNVVLPDSIDVGSLGDEEYHYPDFSVTTDENGKASVSLTKNNLPDGVYVIAERNNTAIKTPVAPFFVLLPYTNAEGNGWEYEISINPKNDVKGDIEIGKDVIEIDNDSATVDAYKTHTWIISASIPEDIANGKEYIISDTLDNRLDFMGNVVVQVENTNSNTKEPVVLTEGTDYVLTVTDNNSLSEGKPSDSFSVEMTSSGMKKVANTVNGDFANHVIRVYFNAQINANANMGEMIPNKATLEYTNSVNVDFDKVSDIPEVHTGGAKLNKVDSNNQSIALAGAVFNVYRPATTEELSDESVEKVYIEEYADTAMVLVSFFDNEMMNGEKVTEVSSDAEGKVVIYGLAYGTYYLVETKAPEGYNLLSTPVELVINANSHLDENAVKVLNSSGTQLPETGGMGTTIFTMVGLTLVLGAGVLLVTRKRMSME